MNLNGDTLDLWLKKQATDNFPRNGKINYITQYDKIKEYLDNNIHPHVVPIANLKDSGYLTDHGIEHIKMVIKRASQLLDKSDFSLSPFEIYLLLVSIQLHDVGHIVAGRKGHEKNSKEVMDDMGLVLSDDNTEKAYIYKIAEAHGGEKQGDKDKISKLESQVHLFDEKVGKQLLAALLRFSDELAEDESRAARYLLQNGRIPNVSQVYHAYAKSLYSLIVDRQGREISLSFNINYKNAKIKLGKGRKKVYLIDEIFERTLKTFCECIYCMRFFPTELSIKGIKIKITFYDDNSEQLREPIVCKLEECGYPDFCSKKIYNYCHNDLLIGRKRITGELISNQIKKKRK